MRVAGAASPDAARPTGPAVDPRVKGKAAEQLRALGYVE
jgi:hypothetical protein